MQKTTLVMFGVTFAAAALFVQSLAWCDEAAAAGPKESAWKTLFDGKSLGKWQKIDKGDFQQSGAVDVVNGTLQIGRGMPASGIRWSGKFPTSSYEISLQAKRTEGDDFFCGLTFPVGDSGLTLIMGGWGGWVVGLSRIDGFYAIDNDTCQAIQFKQDQWYSIRVLVTAEKVKVFVDDKEIIDLAADGHEFSVSDEMQPCAPLGIATWRTTGVLRKIRYRPVPAPRQTEK